MQQSIKQGARAMCKPSEKNGYEIEDKKEKIVSNEIGVTSKGKEQQILSMALSP